MNSDDQIADLFDSIEQVRYCRNVQMLLFRRATTWNMCRGLMEALPYLRIAKALKYDEGDIIIEGEASEPGDQIKPSEASEASEPGDFDKPKKRKNEIYRLKGSYQEIHSAHSLEGITYRTYIFSPVHGIVGVIINEEYISLARARFSHELCGIMTIYDEDFNKICTYIRKEGTLFAYNAGQYLRLSNGNILIDSKIIRENCRGLKNNFVIVRDHADQNEYLYDGETRISTENYKSIYKCRKIKHSDTKNLVSSYYNLIENNNIYMYDGMFIVSTLCGGSYVEMFEKSARPMHTKPAARNLCVEDADE